MVMKCTALCLVALALLGSLCDAQWPGYTSDPNIQKPRPPPRQESKNPFPDNQQSKQTFQKPLTWEYPEDPKPDPKPEGPFELRHPVPAATVSVECRERDAKVAVKKDMFGIGQFISGSDLTLGRCAVAADDVANQEFILMAELHDCDSSVMMTEDFIIYSFTVNYDPRPVGTAPVVRTSKAAVIVECHYPRKHNVSSLPLDPHWIPFSAVKVAEEFLYFTLKLMTDDWKFERPSYQYYLGDMIRIEAAVKQYYHVPLRVYVTHCTATLAPDVNSNPKYMFIQNHGCLIDARVTGSDSRFMARSEENKLQFQLEAFRFHEVDSGMIYITCHLKATSTACPIDAEHRACSFISGWKEASGIDPACDSCESAGLGQIPISNHELKGQSSWNPGTSLPTQGRKSRQVQQSQQFVEWEGDVTLGPIPIMEAAA